MTADTENLVLEHLRHIHGAVDALREDMREVKERLGTLEAVMHLCLAGSIGSKGVSRE